MWPLATPGVYKRKTKRCFWLEKPILLLFPSCATHGFSVKWNCFREVVASLREPEDIAISLQYCTQMCPYHFHPPGMFTSWLSLSQAGTWRSYMWLQQLQQKTANSKPKSTKTDQETVKMKVENSLVPFAPWGSSMAPSPGAPATIEVCSVWHSKTRKSKVLHWEFDPSPSSTSRQDAWRELMELCGCCWMCVNMFFWMNYSKIR